MQLADYQYIIANFLAQKKFIRSKKLILLKFLLKEMFSNKNQYWQSLRDFAKL